MHGGRAVVPGLSHANESNAKGMPITTLSAFISPTHHSPGAIVDSLAGLYLYRQESTRLPQSLLGEGTTASLADTVARLERELDEWRRLATGEYPGSVRVPRPHGLQPERARLRVLPGGRQGSGSARALGAEPNPAWPPPLRVGRIPISRFEPAVFGIASAIKNAVAHVAGLVGVSRRRRGHRHARGLRSAGDSTSTLAGK